MFETLNDDEALFLLLTPGITNVLRIVDFMDAGNRYLDDYSEKRRQIYEAEGFEVKLVPEG